MILDDDKSIEISQSTWTKLICRPINLVEINLSNIEIELASCNMPFDNEIFLREYKDIEDTYSANRFQWLLYLIYHNPTQENINLGYSSIRLWLSTVHQNNKPDVFDSYSISERLLNWIYFISFTKTYSNLDDEFWRDLTKSFNHQIYLLVNKLEYHGEYTNNHIINNARCLYICGSLLDLQKIKVAGRNIIQEETFKFISKGVLQEGSTHYHLLLTRSFIEILYTAKNTDDSDFYLWLQPIISDMLATCTLLHSCYDDKALYPLFGDISPDVYPEWLLGYPFNRYSSIESPWQNLFRFTYHSDLFETECIGDYISHKGSNSWYYLCKNNIEVWVAVKNREDISHGHQDNGSIVVYKDGSPRIIDPGLFNYSNNLFCKYQKSQFAHNLPVIREISEYNWNENYYLKNFTSKCKVLNVNNYSIEISIENNNKGVVLNRSVYINESNLRIIDKIIKADKNNYNYCCSWITDECGPTKVNMKANKYNNTGDASNLSDILNSQLQLEVEETEKSIKYGNKTTVNKLTVNTEIGYNQLIETIIYV